MEHEVSWEAASLLHELDLGLHTLLIRSDGSIDLLAHEKPQPSSLPSPVLRLNSDETYRLFISLHEQFRSPAA